MDTLPIAVKAVSTALNLMICAVIASYLHETRKEEDNGRTTLSIMVCTFVLSIIAMWM